MNKYKFNNYCIDSVLLKCLVIRKYVNIDKKDNKNKALV